MCDKMGDSVQCDLARLWRHEHGDGRKGTLGGMRLEFGWED
jgi:hypothetical protein